MLRVDWCSICNKKEAEGTAVVLDPDNGEIELHLCIDCVRALTPPGEHYSLGL